MPRRGVRSPPGQELLGVATSHGPSRESYRSSRKSRCGTAEASGTPAEGAALSAERMRAALSSAAGAPPEEPYGFEDDGYVDRSLLVILIGPIFERI